MSMNERTGMRDLTYSRWHRPASTKRFLGAMRADRLSIIDIDFCEYCRFCSTPLALIEAQSSNRSPKPATVTKRLAELAGIPAYSVSYTPTEGGDISSFLVRELCVSDAAVIRYTPEDFAFWLESLRIDHLAGKHCEKRRS